MKAQRDEWQRKAADSEIARKSAVEQRDVYKKQLTGEIIMKSCAKDGLALASEFVAMLPTNPVQVLIRKELARLTLRANGAPIPKFDEHRILVTHSLWEKGDNSEKA